MPLSNLTSDKLPTQHSPSAEGQQQIHAAGDQQVTKVHQHLC